MIVKADAAKVSVIIPAFNAAGTLTQCLDSLSRQTLPEWEAVIIDDGSDDFTAEIAIQYGQRDGRVRVIRQPNGGVSAARNAGIAAARGSCLVFLDADDWLDPEHLFALFEAQQEASRTVAFCDFIRVASDGRPFWECRTSEITAQPFATFARRCRAAIHCFMVPRDLVAEIGGFDTNLKTCEDWDFWQRIARIGAEFKHVSRMLAYYRTAEDSLSSDVSQLLKDAERVISQAKTSDPRVQKPDPRYATGVDAEPLKHLALFSLWCAAAEAAKGRDGPPLVNALQAPDLRQDIGGVQASLYEGLVIGLRVKAAEVAPAWLVACEYLLPFLRRYEAVSRGPGFAHQAISALERRILTEAPIDTPVTLTVLSAVNIDIRKPINDFAMPPGIDAVCCRVCADDVVISEGIELPVLGTLSASVVADAVAEAVGWQTISSHIRLFNKSGVWIACLIEAALFAPRVGLAISRLTGAQLSVRGLLRHSLRKIIRASLVVNGSTQTKRPSPYSRKKGTRQSECSTIAKGDRRLLRLRWNKKASKRQAYWEKVFAAPDPWQYESAYEQRKYAQTLSLLEGQTSERALELACAEGFFTQLLAPKVGHLTAADISHRALRRARNRCQGHCNIDFRRIDFIDEPLPHGFDLIVCSEVLYYAENKSQLDTIAAKLKATLVNGGRLITAHAFLLSDDSGHTGFDWGHSFGAKKICEAFQAAGLTLEKSIITELYRIDLFRRRREASGSIDPEVTWQPFGTPLEPQVEAGIVWGGAVVRRSEIAAAKTVRVPVLLYHRIADEGPAALAEYRVTPSAFEEQMRFLRQHGYHTVSSAELAQHRRERRPMCGRPILITFDDGYRDFYQLAWPILRRFGFTAEVFLPLDFIGGFAEWDRCNGTPAELMSWHEIGIAQQQGARFGSHLASHRLAAGLSTKELFREGVRSRAELKKRLGCEIASVAPPYGACGQRDARVLQLCGFSQIFTVDSRPATLDEQLGTIPRIAIGGGDNIDTFAARLGNSAEEPNPTAQLVSVIVPAFNAAHTIDDTLDSVRNQTHRNLDIIVVDDGSTDDTALRVKAHARADLRIRLIRQGNAGVAAARNRAVAAAKGAFISPIDADDLWERNKIEKQMAMMLARGPRCALVYSWQAILDEQGRVISTRTRPTEEGYVLPHMIFGNFVGGGSPTLIRKSAILEFGGYDSSLRAKGAQGCEDFKLYLRISERYDFAVVKEFLTGYRCVSNRMSSDLLQMQRSHDLVAEYAEVSYPRYARLARDSRTYCRASNLKKAFKVRSFALLTELVLDLIQNHPRYALILLLKMPRVIGQMVFRSVGKRDAGLGLPFLQRSKKESAVGPKTSWPAARQALEALSAQK
jgi:glycosyltransferase involved in cell wall biosynthesis/peptidoglycan/xylan/chitin deacetylase (PgdA/CDA1 family)